MNSESTKLIKTEGIFFKIKTIFKKLLKINLKKENENKFKDNIIEKNTEKDRLLNLQAQLRKNQIDEKDISIEDIEKLSNLYDEQIESLKKEIAQNKLNTENYKRQIIALKKQIN